MRRIWTRLIRWRTTIMLMCVVATITYVLLLDGHVSGRVQDYAVDVEELEQELELGRPVRVVTYKPPTDDKTYTIPHTNKSKKYSREYGAESFSRTLSYRRLWSWAEAAVTRDSLFPEAPEVDEIVSAMQQARFLEVDVLRIGKYESGTSEKWLVTLEGGQKAVMKLVWEEKGKMKADALCNYGFEMPTSEIAAFHLHRLLGFRITPYVTGRRVDLSRDVLPVASAIVQKQITQPSGNQTCVVGKCFFCKEKTTLCPAGGVVEASLSYWIPRQLQLHTFPPKYMPYSTPSMEEWEQYGFNNRTYCKKIRDIPPYEQDYYYHDLFDFAALDTLMYHFDSKHYVIRDKSEADGATVRLDHGRAFCANDRDDLHIFMAPLTQCCTMRRSTYERLVSRRGGLLTRGLRQRLDRDPLAPLLEDRWYPALERRLDAILDVMDRCASANGGWENVLV